MARRGEAVDLIANRPAEMPEGGGEGGREGKNRLPPFCESSESPASGEKARWNVRAIDRNSRSREVEIKTREMRDEKKKKSEGGWTVSIEGEAGRRGVKGGTEAHAGKNPRGQEGEREGQADAVTRKADVLNGIKQLST